MFLHYITETVFLKKPEIELCFILTFNITNMNIISLLINADLFISTSEYPVIYSNPIMHIGIILMHAKLNICILKVVKF